MISTLHTCFVRVHRGSGSFPPEDKEGAPWFVLRDRLLRVREARPNDSEAELMVSFVLSSKTLLPSKAEHIELELRLQVCVCVFFESRSASLLQCRKTRVVCRRGRESRPASACPSVLISLRRPPYRAPFFLLSFVLVVRAYCDAYFAIVFIVFHNAIQCNAIGLLGRKHPRPCRGQGAQGPRGGGGGDLPHEAEREGRDGRCIPQQAL